MKKLMAAVLLLICTAAGTVSAAGLDLALSNETAHLSLFINPNKLATGGAELAIGGFINDVDDVLFFASAIAKGTRQTESVSYRLGAGIKLYGGNLDDDEKDQSVGALALGGQAGFLVLPHEFNPIDFTLDIFFAPGITSFGDTESLWEVATRLQLEIIPQARVYLGYRLIKADTSDRGKLEIDDNVHLGINITF